MVITGRGTLERAARLGDEVGVRLAATKKILRGRLTAGGVVVEVSR
jgi:hypothetical protein